MKTNDAGNQSKSGGISEAIARSIGWMVGAPRVEARKPAPAPKNPPKPTVDLDAPTEKLDPDA